jgi:MFS family permease
MDLAQALPPISGRREQTATRIMFFAIGFASGAWAPLIPFAKARLQAGAGELGLLLLCVGAGSILAMPLAGAVAGRLGHRVVLTAATSVTLLVFPLLAILSSAAGLAAALFVFGIGVGSIDCVINMQAIVVERGSGRPLMSGFHALYSLGGIAGAGGVSALLANGASPPGAAFCVAAGLLLAAAGAWPGLLAQADAPHDSPFAAPRGIVLLIAVFCFVVFLTEGSALDWSAVLLRTTRRASAAQAGLGYVAFAAAMTAGRLAGDWLVARAGPVRTVTVGTLAAAAGLGLAALAPGWAWPVAGYGLVGAGCSNVVPVLYSALGRQTAMPESQAVPAVSVVGYAGLLAGPAAIGLVADRFSLAVALLGVAGLLLGVAATARRFGPNGVI